MSLFSSVWQRTSVALLHLLCRAGLSSKVKKMRKDSCTLWKADLEVTAALAAGRVVMGAYVCVASCKSCVFTSGVGIPCWLKACGPCSVVRQVLTDSPPQSLIWEAPGNSWQGATGMFVAWQPCWISQIVFHCQSYDSLLKFNFLLTCQDPCMHLLAQRFNKTAGLTECIRGWSKARFKQCDSLSQMHVNNFCCYFQVAFGSSFNDQQQKEGCL